MANRDTRGIDSISLACLRGRHAWSSSRSGSEKLEYLISPLLRRFEEEGSGHGVGVVCEDGDLHDVSLVEWEFGGEPGIEVGIIEGDQLHPELGRGVEDV